MNYMKVQCFFYKIGVFLRNTRGEKKEISVLYFEEPKKMKSNLVITF